MSSLNLGSVLKPKIIYNLNLFRLQGSISKESDHSSITSWECRKFWKCSGYDAATQHWPALTSKFTRIQSVLQLVLRSKPLGSKHKPYSRASSIAKITGTQCGELFRESGNFQVHNGQLRGWQGARKVGVVAASALRLPGELTEMLGRKTGILSSKSMYCLLEVHWNSTNSVHRDLNIRYSTRPFPSICKGYSSSITVFYPSLNYYWSIVSIRMSHHLKKLPVANIHKTRSLPALLFICLGKWPERQKGNTQYQEALTDLNTWLEEQHLEKTRCLAEHSATGKTFSTGSLGKWEKAASFLISA